MRRCEGRAARRGSTLIEVTIGAVLMFVILGALGLVVRSSSGLASSDMVETSARLDAWRAVSRIAGALNAAGSATLDPALASTGLEHSDALSFQTLLDTSATAAAADLSWHPNSRVWLQYDDGETNNGIDDDGDGLVDECRAMLTTAEGTPQERTIVLVSNVAEYLEGETADGADNNGNGLLDERGLCFAREGDVLRLRLTIGRRDERGQVSTATVNASVRLRN